MARRVLTRRFGALASALLLGGCGASAGDGAAAPQTDPPAASEAATPPSSDEPTAATPAGDGAAARTITVGGMGADYGAPDRSVVEIGVSARRPTVVEATRAAAAAGASLIEALRAAGVPAENIQTSQFGINPVHDQFDYTRVVGYECQIGYRVTIADLDELGAALARVVEAGGDMVRAWSVSFDGDPAGHMDVARAEAWDDVRERAAATAEAAGEPLGEVLDVHEKVLLTSPQGMMQGGEGDAVPFDIPVSPGVVGVIVLLTVTYAIGA